MINVELERAIDDVGRVHVFALMGASGWTVHDSIPLWMWWEAVRIIRSGESPIRDFFLQTPAQNPAQAQRTDSENDG